jgi:drug/metabolite transporter (DMT)-like permease
MYALSAAVIWGIHYNLLSKSMTVITPLTAYWLPSVLMIAGLPIFYKTLVADYYAVMAAPLEVKISTIVIAFTSVMASVALYKAIQMHNPTHAGLIEITYPIFIGMFGILLFKEHHIDVWTLVGGALILAGSSVIIYHHG